VTARDSRVVNWMEKWDIRVEVYQASRVGCVLLVVGWMSLVHV
jgi:hypothetical protein